MLFRVFADRNNLDTKMYQQEREKFFSKGQACFRASPLTKRYGFGVHSDDEGKIALYGIETKEYAKFVKDKTVKKVRAMRSKKI